MTTVAMSGSDTVILNNRTLTDFAAGNVAELTLPNEIAKVKVGKNGNTIYGLDFSGLIVDFKLLLIRGSGDDQFLNNLLTSQTLNFAGFPLMIGQFIKYIGDGTGKITADIYNMAGGIFVKQVPARTNSEGEPEQSLSEYTLKFSNNGIAVRTLVK